MISRCFLSFTLQEGKGGNRLTKLGGKKGTARLPRFEVHSVDPKPLFPHQEVSDDRRTRVQVFKGQNVLDLSTPPEVQRGASNTEIRDQSTDAPMYYLKVTFLLHLHFVARREKERFW